MTHLRTFLPILSASFAFFFLLLCSFFVHAQPFVEVEAEMIWQRGGNPDYLLGLQPSLEAGFRMENVIFKFYFGKPCAEPAEASAQV